MEEKWKKIDGTKYYQISNLGHLRRIKCDGKFKYISGHSDKLGNRIFKLVKLDGTRFVKTQRRLVAEAFVPNKEGKWTIRCKDGDITNCVYTNLCWKGPSEWKRTLVKRNSFLRSK